MIIFKVLCLLCALELDVTKIDTSIRHLLNPFKVDYFAVMLLFGILFYFFKKINGKISKRKKILCGLFSFFTLISQSYMKVGSWYLVFGNFLNFFLSIYFWLGYYFLFERLFVLFDQYLHKEEKKIKLPFLFHHFDDHPFLFSFVFLFLCYGIYILAFYPGILSNDPSFQIMQYFNIPNKYSEYSVLLDPNVHLTNHHPIFHTLLLGSCISIGRWMGSDNFGLFIYTIIQMTFLITVLSYSISYTKKVNISLKRRIILLSIYAFVPMFPFYGMSLVKDTFYTCFILLYIIFLYDYIQFYNKKKYHVKQFCFVLLLLLCICAFRNNGFYVVLFSFPCIFIFEKSRKQWILLFCLFLCLHVGYTKILLPSFKITNGSIREALSIPFQQTARYNRYYQEEVTDEEKEIINQILPYQKMLQKYDPEISDPVKNQFNRYATKEDLKKYFSVWEKQFLKHPNMYIEATIHNTYGYIYPGKTNWYLYSKYSPIVKERNVVDYHYNSLKSLRQFLTAYGNVFLYIPFLGLISNIGFGNWIIMIMSIYYIERKKRKNLLFLMPCYLSFLVCLASPVNCYFRYAMPIIFSIPFLWTIFLKEIKNN